MKFSKGDRVRLSAEGHAAIPRSKSIKAGTVVGFGREGDTIRVLRDGVKHPESWHKDFWEVVTADTEVK